jgi:hypothetical protein
MLVFYLLNVNIIYAMKKEIEISKGSLQGHLKRTA